MAHRAEGGRVHARQGRPAAPGDGQEEARGPRRRVRRLRGRDDGQRLLRRGDQDPVGHPRPVLRLRLQQGAHAPRTGWSPTGRPTSRRTTRPSTWPALLTSVRDDKDKSALYLNECRRMGIKVLPPDVNSSAADFTPVGTDIRFGLTAIRNVGANVVDAIVATREEKGRFTSLRRLPAEGPRRRLQQADHRVADQGRRLRLLGPHPARPARRCTRSAVDDRGRRQAAGGDRPVRPVRRPRRRRRRRARRCSRRDPAPCRSSSKKEKLLPRAGDARALRLRPPAVRRRARPVARRGLLDRHPDRRTTAARTAPTVTIAGMISGLQRKMTKTGQPVGDRDGRGPRRRDRGAVLPADVPDGLARPRRGPRRRRPRPGQPAGRRADDLRAGAHACPTSTRATAARSSCRCR